MNYKLLKKLSITMLLILVSASTYSQRIRTIGTDTFVAFSREQAKAINNGWRGIIHNLNICISLLVNGQCLNEEFFLELGRRIE